mmetsp:Transcript_11606/g.22248  ORF Transcript_11606/g.22248 Transcript_11606/m.22248 type:complete len:389 (+) Transcript_11606:589-1755(+)
MEENRQELVLRRVTLFVTLRFVVTEAKVHLLEDSHEMDSFRQVVMHLPNHGQHIVIHRQCHVIVDVTQTLDDFVGEFIIMVRGLSFAEISKPRLRHPMHLFLSDGGKASLLCIDATDHGSERSVAIVVDKVLGIIRIVRGSQGLLEIHDGVPRFLSGDLTDLSEHKILNVRPLHSEIDDVSLDIQTATTSATLHLLRNKRGQIIAHITAEEASTERHVNTVREGVIGKDNTEASFLSQHLHLAAVAGETVFVCVDGDTTTEATNERMINIDFLSRLLHVGNDVFRFLVAQTLTSGRKDVFIVRLCRVFLDQRFVDNAIHGILFRFLGVLATSLSGCDFTHLRLLLRNLDQITAVVGELGNLLAFKTAQKVLEHVERPVCVELESNSWE